MKHGFARKETAAAPSFRPETIELPTPLKVPPPQSKPLWSVVLIVGLMGLVGAMVWVSFASGARVVYRGGLAVSDRHGRWTYGDAVRRAWRFSGDVTVEAGWAAGPVLHGLDELRGTTSELADQLDENYRWYHPAAGDAGSQSWAVCGCGSAKPTALIRGSVWHGWAWA